MGKKIKKFVRGRLSEYKQRRAASAIIRKKAVAEGLRERKRQEIRLARDKEKLRAQQKLKRYKTGGTWGAISRGMSNVQKNVASNQRRVTGTKLTKGKKKKIRQSPGFDFDSFGKMI